MKDCLTDRRNLLLMPLLAALPTTLITNSAAASPLDPSQTIYKLPDQIEWRRRPDDPPNSVESATLFGDLSSPGIYYVLVKWYPGYMSAPHTYITDRLCVVVSGTWWINSGPDFDPDHTVPAPAGSFVRRVAHTPHYDGVRIGGAEPAVIAICGIAPVSLQLIETDKPLVRKL
ncbi:MAG: cupin domain-containing protein [Acetobacteraceae bacterium]|nr:cupin domain-containing protein [Acetobacteraceae bacterium]MBV8578857.1 cupin domain-containing protein [Acetobacteraceae bacterium]